MSDKTFGDILRERRMQLGLSIEQAVLSTKLRPQVLRAFEAAEFSEMPPKGYAQGMLTSYARYLDLDPQELLEQYFAELREYERDKQFHDRAKASHRRGATQDMGRNRNQTPARAARGQASRSQGQFVFDDSASFGVTQEISPRMPQMRDLDDNHVSYTKSSQAKVSTGSMRRPGVYGDIGSYDDYSLGSVHSRRRQQQVAQHGWDNEPGLDDYYAQEETTEFQDPRLAAASKRINLRSQNARRSPYEGSGGAPQIRKKHGGLGGASVGLMQDPKMRLVVLIGAIMVLLALVIGISLAVSSCVKAKAEQEKEQAVVEQALQQQVPATTNQTQQQAEQGVQAAGNQAAPQDQNAAQNGVVPAEQEAAVGPQELTFEVNQGQSSWVEVTNNGKNVFAAQVGSGTKQSFDIDQTLTITVATPDAVVVSVDGQRVTLEQNNGIGTYTVKAAAEQPSASQ